MAPKVRLKKDVEAEKERKRKEAEERKNKAKEERDKDVIPFQEPERGVVEKNTTVIVKDPGGNYRGVPASMAAASSTVHVHIEDVPPKNNADSGSENYAATPPPNPPNPPTPPPSSSPPPSASPNPIPWIIGGVIVILLFLLIGLFLANSTKEPFVFWHEDDRGRIHDVEERSDGLAPSYTVDPDTTFISGAHGVQLWTSGHNFSNGEAHITYDFVVAPQESYRIYGEILDANGNSIRRKEGTDTGTVSVEIYPSDRERGATSLAVLVVYGQTANQARSDFIPINWNQIASPSTSSPPPPPATSTSPAPASTETVDDGEYIIDTENVTFE